MKKILVLLVSMLIMHEAAAVSTGYYLITTYSDEGQKTVEYDFWSVKTSNATAVSSPEIGLGYGVTSRWYTELYVADLSTESAGTVPNNVAWQNDYLLTQGEYPVDVAIHTLIKHYHDTDDGTGFEFGPVLQADIDRVQLNGNLFFERNYDAVQANNLQLKYQLQAKYRWRSPFAVGLQAFGEPGDWNHLTPDQSHRIGPAVFGSLPQQGGKEIKLEAAYLIGPIEGKEAKAFTMRAAYAF